MSGDSSYKPPTKRQGFVYDLIIWIFSIAFDCFFREIRTRGAYKVPKNPNQAIIFVAAPHGNQFVDGILLLETIQKEAHRRISFLVAAKSFKDKIVGALARSIMSIPVSRAQDNLTLASGTIKYAPGFDGEENLTIIGSGTKFTAECEENCLISLPKSMGSTVIDKIISDTELTLKKDFKISSSKYIETLLKLLQEGTSYKTAPKIDQTEVYSHVFEHLKHGHSIGIFPEGGSHDRPHLLPLKLGVAIMALGAVANDPACNVKIVPCGMYYFNRHKFRSRCMVEFGDPMDVDSRLVEMYKNPETSKDAVRELLDQIKNGLNLVTVTCPDYDTLICVQVARRLYSNNFSSRLSLELNVEMKRRLVAGYTHFQNEPRLQLLKKKILKYNDLLKIHQIPDHDVEKCKPRIKAVTLALLLINFSRVFFLLLFCVPGFLMFSPIFIATKKISTEKSRAALAASTVKIKAMDIIATWKILVAMGLAPLLYTLYSVIGTSLLWYYGFTSGKRQLLLAFWSSYLFCSVITYSALIIGDKGMDYFKSLRPLYLALIDEAGVAELKQLRKELTLEITELVNDFGPELYPDFNLLDIQQKLHDKKLLEQETKYEKSRLKKLSKKQKLRDAQSGINRINSTFDLSSIPIFSTDKSSDVEMTSISSANATSDLTTDGEMEEEEEKIVSQKIRERIITNNRLRDDDEEDEDEED